MSELAGQTPAPTPTPTPYDVPEVPAAAWALGWSFVVGQVLELIRRGAQDESAWVLSMVLGAVLVVLVVHGVMRVRRVRFWLVVVLLALAVVFTLVGVVVEPTWWGVVTLVLAVLQAWLLHAYTRTAWFAWQRTRPDGGPSLVPILAVAALVGVLGGLLGSPSDAVGMSFNVRV